MKVFLLAVIFILTSTMAMAEPVLLGCNIDPMATEYVVEFNHVVLPAAEPMEYRENVTVVINVEDMIVPFQINFVRFKALNAWGDESEWSLPLEFLLSDGGLSITRQQPGAPQVVRVVSD